jgi:hypothetical protein
MKQQLTASFHDFAVSLGRFLGLMAYLEGKPEGDNSMPGK